MSAKRAAFLDRDGVLIAEQGLVTICRDVQLLDGVPSALLRLKACGYLLVVVTNQAVIARGLATEEVVRTIHGHIGRLVSSEGGPTIDAFYFCPHHPNATLLHYRLDCDCRKPRPGMLWRAARELGLDLTKSFLVGDRITDVAAGITAGCRTVLVQTGAHDQPPIETSEPLDPHLEPHFTCGDLEQATDWILAQS